MLFIEKPHIVKLSIQQNQENMPLFVSIVSLTHNILTGIPLDMEGKYFLEDLQHPSVPNFQLVEGHSRSKYRESCIYRGTNQTDL